MRKTFIRPFIKYNKLTILKFKKHFRPNITLRIFYDYHNRISKTLLAWPATWRYFAQKKTEQGTQIDLLFDRADRIITLCEIKFSKTEFSIDKKYAENLKNKISVFKEKTKTKKMINMVLITASGLKQNSYANELIVKSIKLEQLF